MKKSGYAESSAKIIWFGEHSVVYGQPAIALPLPAVKVQVTIKVISGDNRILSRYYDGDWQSMPSEMNGIKKLVDYLSTLLQADDLKFEIQIISDIPAERGMGSSAATAVAITRAFFALFERHLTRDVLLTAANISEQVTHGNPSGLDAATASASWPIWYVKNKENLPLPIDLPEATLVIADSGTKGKTSTAVNQVHEQLMLEPDSTGQYIKQMGAIVQRVPAALKSNDVQALGELMNQNHQLLQKLHVSTPQLDLMQQAALAAGALGAKLTGSGLGGCLIAIAADRQSAQRVASRLTAHGASATWLQPLNQFENQE